MVLRSYLKYLDQELARRQHAVEMRAAARKVVVLEAVAAARFIVSDQQAVVDRDHVKKGIYQHGFRFYGKLYNFWFKILDSLLKLFLLNKILCVIQKYSNKQFTFIDFLSLSINCAMKKTFTNYPLFDMPMKTRRSSNHWML